MGLACYGEVDTTLLPELSITNTDHVGLIECDSNAYKEYFCSKMNSTIKLNIDKNIL